MSGWPYIAPLETETISRMVRARREWWARKRAEKTSGTTGPEGAREGFGERAPMPPRARKN